MRYVNGQHPAWHKPNVTGDETCLYRCYDDSGVLVYVGITRDPRRRHQRDRFSPARGATSIDWEWVPTHAEARRRERALIVEHAPAWNEQHVPAQRRGVSRGRSEGSPDSAAPPVLAEPPPRPVSERWSSVTGRPWPMSCTEDVLSLHDWCLRCGWPHQVHGDLSA